jgi:hypothetical protein
MHVVRNALSPRSVLPIYLCRRRSAAATLAVESVHPLEAPLQQNGTDHTVAQSSNPDFGTSASANASGFETFKDLTMLHVPPTTFQAKKKKPKKLKKLKANTNLMAKSGQATSRYKESAKGLMQTLKSIGYPIEPEVPPSVEKRSRKTKREHNLASPRTDRGIDGWKGEDWGSDGQHCELYHVSPHCFSCPSRQVELRPREEELVQDLPNDGKTSPPHIRSPITYTRRVEGLLTPLDQPILQGA